MPRMKGSRIRLSDVGWGGDGEVSSVTLLYGQYSRFSTRS